MTLEKGHEVLIKGFAKALNSYSPERPVYLLLAGGGELEESLKLLAKNLKFESKVIVTGVFERDYLEKFYNTFDIFIFPSLAEGFGLVLIEAMANALPVISSDLEVLREVGGPDVVYFKSQDSDDLKDKIVDMLKTTSVEKTEIGIKLRNRVTENFSLDEFIENYFSLYQNLLKKS
jgi:glycosyltransferase involved in cell wall biosynthesis